MAHFYDLSTWEAEAGREFKAGLGYIARPCLKNREREN
jgi:hypothetical protein